MTIDDLNRHMFETIEMLKNNNDSKASKNEKIDVDTANTIAKLGSVIVEGFKMQVNAVSILSRTKNPGITGGIVSGIGVLPEYKQENK